MSSLDGVRVVLIEDEAHVAILIEAMLDDLGGVVVGAAARVSKALDLIAETPFDLALLDLNLAGELSFAVADVLAARRKPFVVVTGYGAAGLPVEHRSAPVVSKPFREHQLRDAILVALGR